VEPPEAPLPAEERPRAPGQEPGGEGRADHGEAELPAVRHDHAPADQQPREAAAHQARAGGRAGPLGERRPAHGQAAAGAHLPGALVRRAGERLRPAAGRAVRPRHEAREAAAGAGARGREREGQRQRAAVGRRGRLHQVRR